MVRAKIDLSPTQDAYARQYPVERRLSWGRASSSPAVSFLRLVSLIFETLASLWPAIWLPRRSATSTYGERASAPGR